MFMFSLSEQTSSVNNNILYTTQYALSHIHYCPFGLTENHQHVKRIQLNNSMLTHCKSHKIDVA